MSQKHRITKNLRFWGHNCFSVESNSTVLLIDPWLSNAGAFYGSWFQYPKNHHLKDDLISYLESADKSYIFITHEHEDHYDKSFLREFLGADLIIPDYQDKTFRNELLQINKNVKEVKDSVQVNLNDDIEIKLLISDIGINHDSAILCKTPEFTFLNQNDCKIFDRLREIEEKVDFYSVQFSGATWYPSSFLLSEKRKSIISKEKVVNKFKNVLRGIKVLNPDYFVPAAGPAIFPFLDPQLSSGKENIFVHQDQLQKYLKNSGYHNSVFLRPGGHFNSGLNQPLSAPDDTDFKDYRKNIVNTWESIANSFNRSKLEQQVIKRFAAMEEVEIQNTPMLIFNFGGIFNESDHTRMKKMFIDLNNKRLVDSFDYSSAYEEVISSEKYFDLMCSERWQNVYLSLRAQVVRRPDIFNNDLNIFLFSDPSSIKENYLRTRNVVKERVMVKNSLGEIYEINKFCPHQGADLCNAEITDQNILICPRHGWRFNLSEMGKDAKSGETINAVKK